MLDGVGVHGVLADHGLNGESGLELLATIQARDPSLPIALLTGRDLRPLANHAARIGALLFAKPASLEDLDAFCRRARERLERGLAPFDHLDDADRLSTRERECLRRAFAHRTYKEIATDLGISPTTVQTHVHRALRRFGVTSVESLRARLALRVRR